MIGECFPRKRAEEFRRFLDTVDTSVPTELDMHVVVDNSSTQHRQFEGGSKGVRAFTCCRYAPRGQQHLQHAGAAVGAATLSVNLPYLLRRYRASPPHSPPVAGQSSWRRHVNSLYHCRRLEMEDPKVFGYLPGYSFLYSSTNSQSAIRCFRSNKESRVANMPCQLA